MNQGEKDKILEAARVTGLTHLTNGGEFPARNQCTDNDRTTFTTLKENLKQLNNEETPVPLETRLIIARGIVALTHYIESITPPPYSPPQPPPARRSSAGGGRKKNKTKKKSNKSKKKSKKRRKSKSK